MGFLETENAGQLLGTGPMGWGRGCQSQPELGGASPGVHSPLPGGRCGSYLGASGATSLACQTGLLLPLLLQLREWGAASMVPGLQLTVPLAPLLET